MIADFLSEHGIPFRYEAKLLIDGKAYYPDFVILCEDDTLILWEHFGLMSQDEYFKRACEKIKTYRKKGYMQHTNLICTWEEDTAAGKTGPEEILERFGTSGAFQIPCLMGERQHDPQTVVSGNAGVLWSDFDLVFSWKSCGSGRAGTSGFCMVAVEAGWRSCWIKWRSCDPDAKAEAAKAWYSDPDGVSCW